MGKNVRKDTVIKVISGEHLTPFSLAKKLEAKVILESSSFKKGKERYSVLLTQEAFRVFQEGPKVYFKYADDVSEIKSSGKDILDVLQYFAAQHESPAQDFPFPAGGIGYLSYEFCRFCDKISLEQKVDDLGLFDADFIFGHIFIIFDHYTDLIYIIGLNYREHEINIELAVRLTEEKIKSNDFTYLNQAETSINSQIIDDDKKKYLTGVETIRDEIIKGNLLQAVLSRRLRIKTELSALDAYRKLRSSNPSPYLFYLNYSTHQLFGSSPEVHVKLKNGTATIRPIAGTRRRGNTKQEDASLEKDLLADTKEKAEHLMLIDLARNDLGRISVAGTVCVKDYMTIERYSHVMHIVSEIQSTLKEGMTGPDLIRATFPAGTVSGAPKIQAIKTLDKLENQKRSFYAGLVGYFEPNGGLDTCITIRSALKKGDSIYLQAGAGIVYDSKPERELEETNEKLRALAKSIGVEI